MNVLTPDRQIEILLDHPESVQVEPYFAKRWTRFEVQKPVLTNVEQLASGVFILKPRGTALHALHETTAGQVDALPLSVFDAPAILTQIPMQRSLTELTGVAPAAHVSASGDYFYKKRITAGATWNQQLISALPTPPLPTLLNYPLDLVMQFKEGLHVADQGYVLRWVHPAHPAQMIDYVMTFVFGGKLTPEGYGLFELAFGGDGRAFLFEWINGWVLVDEWRYASSELIPGMPHTIRIIPHVRYLEVRSNVTERTQPGALFQNARMNAFAGRSVALDAHVYEAKNRGGLPPRPGALAYPVTGPGAPAFRVRRDVMLTWQAARVTYPATGTLISQPFTVPAVNTSTHPLEIKRYAAVLVNSLTMAPHGSTSGVAVNALTGLDLAALAESYTIGPRTITQNGYALPGSPNAVKVRITLTNNDGSGGPYSPWFFGYEARKRGGNATTTPTQVAINGTHYRQSPCTRLSFTGPDSDPSHETASFRLCDLVNRIPRLAVRGEGSVKITSTHDPADQTKKTVLFEGYYIKSEAVRRGNLTKSYPSPDWRDYDLTLMGKWKRLHERDYVNEALWSFAEDVDDTLPPEIGSPGVRPPWKVTDAIRWLLATAGVNPATQVDVPDMPQRLYFSGMGNWDDVVQLTAGANISEFAQRLALDYLNRVLLWDANAGAAGMWRLKAIPTGSEAAVWTFKLEGPPPGRLATVMGAYGTNACTVHKDTLSEWSVAPEGNYIRVSGQKADTDELIVCDARNPKAYNRPGESTADPNHPDYTRGEYQPIFRRHDPTLNSLAAVMFVTRRVFDLACRAQQFARFEAPLVFINAATAEPSIYTVNTHRALMFSDVVSIGSATLGYAKYMIRQVSATVRKQHHQLAVYECQKFNAPLPA